MSPAELTVPEKIVRRQFPVPLAWAVTINKSQGQLLLRPCLSVLFPLVAFYFGFQAVAYICRYPSSRSTLQVSFALTTLSFAKSSRGTNCVEPKLHMQPRASKKARTLQTLTLTLGSTSRFCSLGPEARAAGRRFHVLEQHELCPALLARLGGFSYRGNLGWMHGPWPQFIISSCAKHSGSSQKTLRA